MLHPTHLTEMTRPAPRIRRPAPKPPTRRLRRG